ncbi:MAG: hypothetical protein CMJ05_10875, partial [Pelagibacterales bacterium]|nr:hypothetical protein [Pelagibacterales bacterium]
MNNNNNIVETKNISASAPASAPAPVNAAPVNKEKSIGDHFNSFMNMFSSKKNDSNKVGGRRTRRRKHTNTRRKKRSHSRRHRGGNLNNTSSIKSGNVTNKPKSYFNMNNGKKMMNSMNMSIKKNPFTMNSKTMKNHAINSMKKSANKTASMASNNMTKLASKHASDAMNKASMASN